jgi:hypothetical protein
MSIPAALRADDRPHFGLGAAVLERKAAARHVQTWTQRYCLSSGLSPERIFEGLRPESGEAEEDHVPVTPRHYLYQEAVSKTGPCYDFNKNDPALVVFRPCFGTSSEHLGQAGCFRLPIKACRPQSPLCVSESFNLRFECFSRWPRTGQGKFKLKSGKERDCLGRSIHASLTNQVKEVPKKTAEALGTGKVSSQEAPASIGGRALLRQG